MGTCKALCWSLLAARVVLGIDHPEEYANPLAGTFTHGQQFSTGNTIPITARPWGFNHWSVQTNSGDSSWWFGGNDHTFRWLRCTHQPSPWIGDYGWFLFGPQMGGRDGNPTGYWEPRAAHFKPHIFDATIAPDGMRIELAPTMHGAVLRVRFPEHNPRNLEKRICFKLPGGSGDKFWGTEKEPRAAYAMSTRHSGGVPKSGFAHYVRIEGDPASRDGGGGFERVETARNLMCFAYARDETEAVVRMASSFISADQAKATLGLQLGRGAKLPFADPASLSSASAGGGGFFGFGGEAPTFDDIAADARAEWQALLGRADVVDADGAPGGVTSARSARHLTAFYTGLYRLFLFPRRIDEVTSAMTQ